MMDPKKLRNFLAKKRGDKARKPMEKLIQLLRDGLKLGYTIAGKNTSRFDEKTMKFVSPRFLSVVPEEGSKDGKDGETVCSLRLLGDLFSWEWSFGRSYKRLLIPRMS